jgi:single-stranded DNA-binding protein
VNAVHLSDRVSNYGPRISWTEQGKAQTTLTFKTFVPVLIVGGQAEHYAKTLEGGQLIAVSGKLAYRAGKTKDAGKSVVTCFTVEVLARHLSARQTSWTGQ